MGSVKCSSSLTSGKFIGLFMYVYNFLLAGIYDTDCYKFWR